MRGLSQEQLAEEAEMHHTFISNLERGKVSASAYSLYKVSRALSVRLVDLLAVDNETALDELDLDLATISKEIRSMHDGKRKICLAAIRGMLAE